MESTVAMTKRIMLSFRMSDEVVPNELITEEQIALANAIGATIAGWMSQRPRTTRDDVERALCLIPHMLAPQDHGVKVEGTANVKDEERTWLTVREAGKYLKCGTNPIYTAIERHELKAVSINARGDLRIKREWVDAWLTARAEHSFLESATR